MTLVTIIAVLFCGGILAWASERLRPGGGRWCALLALIVALALFARYLPQLAEPVSNLARSGAWLEQVQWQWIPRFGIQFFLAMDGLGFLMLALTLTMGLFGLLITWNQVSFRRGFFYFNYLWTLAGVVGVFTAMDLFLFFFFWEVMLIPMLFLIAVWGYEARTYAAIKFFIFTQASSLLMLVAIVALAFIHYQANGVITFSLHELMNTPMSDNTQYWLMLGFFVAFAVKLPAIPLHPWLPDAHTQAPTAGSILLAAILLKTGAYGLLRFTLPLFPAASVAFAPVAMWIGAVSIVYGALMAFAQQDMKRLVAYSSVSHMGFVLIGIYALNTVAIQGAVMQMVAHGLSTAALFAIVGALQHRLHTRDMAELGGLWATLPKLAAIALFFVVASLGLPGLGNFVAEFLVLAGSFGSNIWATVIAALGLIGAALYALRLMQKTFFGQAARPLAAPNGNASASDLDARDSLLLLSLAVGLVWLGIQPQPVLNLTEAGVDQLVEHLQNEGPLQANTAGETAL